MEFSQRPNRPSRCTWEPNCCGSPHPPGPGRVDRSKILPDILHNIGATPMVKLNRIPEKHQVKCEIYAKCEFFNPGGSVKERIAYRMILEAEKKGILKPDSTIIEPTSGNTGIGLAMCAAVKGYKCIIVMPEKMSNEKVYAIRALGAEIVRTPTEAAWDSPDAHINIAHKLQKEIPNSVVLDQYTNSGNPLAHYEQTAEEIFEQCDGKVDYIVAGAGTGGTITGIGRKFKEISPHTKIVAVDPKGSILALPHHLNENEAGFYEVEGIGYDFVPTVFDRSVVDIWVKTDDKESLNAARMLIREEGLMCGGSSGSALTAALQLAKDIPAGKRMVVLLPDGIRNYMTKFVSDDWMIARGFLPTPEPIEANKWWWKQPVSNLTMSKPTSIKKETTTINEALNLIKKSKLEEILIINNDGCPEGVIIPSALMSRVIAGSLQRNDFIEKGMEKQYTRLESTTSLGLVSKILEREPFAIIQNPGNDHVVGIVHHVDILNYVTKDNGIATMNNHHKKH